MTGQTGTASVQADGPAIPEEKSLGAADSAPVAVGVSMTARHEYRFNGKGPYPSVTTILGIMDKGHALAYWFGKRVAEAAVQRDEWRSMPPADAVVWLAKQPDDNRNSSAVLGTLVHQYADMAARGLRIDAEGLQPPQEAIPYLQAFAGFLGRYGASAIVSSEKAVWSDSAAYAGTYDILMLIDGQLWLVDIKTSAGVYPEYALQLAGYGNAEYIVLPFDPTRYPMPKVERYGVLHLRPDKYPDTGYRLIELAVGHREYVAFLAARELWQWRQEHKG